MSLQLKNWVSEIEHAPAMGAQVLSTGVNYCVWAPNREAVSVLVRPRLGGTHRVMLRKTADGYFMGLDPDGVAGDRYWFDLPNGERLPDLASRYQPEGVEGPSECIDPLGYEWEARTWERPRSLRDQVIYELHVGTFSPEGTFRGAINKLDHIAALGATAIELMPVGDFPGDRNWGYDGVALFAPAHGYGRPDDLRALIDAAHGRGLAVILDVVYNHVGSEGNVFSSYSPFYFHSSRKNDWGDCFNLDGEQSGPVRSFFLQNAAYWFDEYRVDGLRLDATHAIHDESPTHLLAEIVALAHARKGFVIAEDERNAVEILQKEDGSGFGIDAVWSDDFHHQVRVALTGVREAYFANYDGTPEALRSTLEQGWFYCGQPFPPWDGKPRGSSCTHLGPECFVFCIENHDQVGNRALGERLEHLVSPSEFRAASTLLCLSPYTPFLFMGQEWAASSPFLFFTDRKEQGEQTVAEGRRKEFEQSGLNAHCGNLEDMPDPQEEETFLRSKLVWPELGEAAHASTLACTENASASVASVFPLRCEREETGRSLPSTAPCAFAIETRRTRTFSFW